MRRWVTACAGLMLLVSACDRTTEARVDERRVGIYAAAFDSIYRGGPWVQREDTFRDTFREVILNARICWVSQESPGHPEVGEVIVAGYGEDAICQDSFSPDEQAALLAALPGLPNARFTSDPEEVGERIADGDLGGIALMLLVGPVQGVGDRVQVPAGSFCGHLCAQWMTVVVERRGDEWEVTGFTGPVGMA